MAKSYFIAVGTVLCVTALVQIYFGTVFNESVRHAFDVPAMLFVAPVLLLNYSLNLGLPFDGPDHTAVIWLSGLIYAALSIGLIALMRRVRPSRIHSTSDNADKPDV